MKKILGLSVAALMVMGLVGGGTWAYFSDFEESTGNIFGAGTLVIGLANTTGSTDTTSTSATFSSSAWAPGDTEETGSLFIYNGGTIAAAKLTIKTEYVNVDYTDFPGKLGTRFGAGPDAVGANATFWAITENLFDEMITIKTAKWGGSDGTVLLNLVGESLADLKDSEVLLATAGGGVTLASETEAELYLEFEFGSAATNGCQGNEIDVTVTITAYQDTSQP